MTWFGGQRWFWRGDVWSDDAWSVQAVHTCHARAGVVSARSVQPVPEVLVTSWPGEF